MPPRRCSSQVKLRQVLVILKGNKRPQRRKRLEFWFQLDNKSPADIQIRYIQSLYCRDRSKISRQDQLHCQTVQQDKALEIPILRGYNKKGQIHVRMQIQSYQNEPTGQIPEHAVVFNPIVSP